MANYEYLNEVLLTDDTELVAIPSHLNSIKPAVLKNSLYDTDRPLNVKMNKTLGGTDYYLNNIQGRLSLDNKFIKNDTIFRNVDVFAGTENGEIVYETSSKTYKYYNASVSPDTQSLGNSIKIVTYDFTNSKTVYLIECPNMYVGYEIIDEETTTYQVTPLNNLKVYSQFDDYGFFTASYKNDDDEIVKGQKFTQCDIVSNPLENKSNLKIKALSQKFSITFYDNTNSLMILQPIFDGGFTEFHIYRMNKFVKSQSTILNITDYVKKNILFAENDLVEFNGDIFRIPFSCEQLFNNRVIIKEYNIDYDTNRIYRIIITGLPTQSDGKITIKMTDNYYTQMDKSGGFSDSSKNFSDKTEIKECWLNGKKVLVPTIEDSLNSITFDVKEFNTDDDISFDDISSPITLNEFFVGSIIYLVTTELNDSNPITYHYSDNQTTLMYDVLTGFEQSINNSQKFIDAVEKIYGTTDDVKNNIMEALYQNTIPSKKIVKIKYTYVSDTKYISLIDNTVYNKFEILNEKTGIFIVFIENGVLKYMFYSYVNTLYTKFFNFLSNPLKKDVIISNVRGIISNVTNYVTAYYGFIIQQNSDFKFIKLNGEKDAILSIDSISNLPSNTNHIEMKLINNILYATVFANNVEFGKLELNNGTWNYIKIGNINDNDNIAFKRDTKEYKIYKISTGSGYRYFKREKYYFKEITLSEKQSEINIENTDLYSISKDKIVATKRKIKGKISKIRQKDNTRDFVLVPAIAVVIVKSSSYKENVIKSMPCLLKMRYSVNENQDYSYWDSLSKGGFKSIKEIYMEDAVEGGSIGEGSLNYFLLSVYNINYNVKKLRPYNVNKRLHYKSQMEFFNTLSEIDDFINNIENLNLFVYSVKNKVKYKTIYQNVTKLVEDKNNIVNYTWGDTILNSAILLQSNRLPCIDVTINYDLPVNIEVSQEYNLNIIDSKIYDSVNNDFKFNITENFIYMCNRNCLTNDWNTIAYRMFDDDYTLNSTEKYIDNFIEYKNALIDITINKRAVQPNINKCVTLENMDSVQLQIPRNGVIYIGLQNDDVTITDTPTETVINIYDNTTKYNY